MLSKKKNKEKKLISLDYIIKNKLYPRHPIYKKRKFIYKYPTNIIFYNKINNGLNFIIKLFTSSFYYWDFIKLKNYYLNYITFLYKKYFLYKNVIINYIKNNITKKKLLYLKLLYFHKYNNFNRYYLKSNNIELYNKKRIKIKYIKKNKFRYKFCINNLFSKYFIIIFWFWLNLFFIKQNKFNQNQNKLNFIRFNNIFIEKKYILVKNYRNWEIKNFYLDYFHIFYEKYNYKNYI
jgi:hypothetical protein